jgi:hypothetical protein
MDTVMMAIRPKVRLRRNGLANMDEKTGRCGLVYLPPHSAQRITALKKTSLYTTTQRLHLPLYAARQPLPEFAQGGLV